MTLEEITQTLQTVASNQAQTSADIGALREQTEKLAGASQVLEDAAALHQQVLRDHATRQAMLEKSSLRIAEAHQTLVQMLAHHEERLDGQDVARREADDRLDALINAQVRYEARQERLDAAFRQIAESHQTLVQMLAIHEDRLDAGDKSQSHTDGRLDALLDSQIDFNARLMEIAEIQAARKREADERGARLDARLAQLAEAQARTDERIRALLERNGSKKPKASAKKSAAKKRGGAK
ncbi:MAG: hypothetical protein JMDDDDMK_00747 [Acidobacteria bacterium]|nr:hypothetical protein [Acidobacteriota bacterium]